MIALDDWRSLDVDRAGRYARAVAAAVGADDVELGRPDSTGQPMRLARFRISGQVYSLVPGGAAELGYDATRYQPVKAELASFLGDHDALRPHPDDADDGGHDDGEDRDVVDPWRTPLPVLPGQLELLPMAAVTTGPTPAPPPWRPAAGDLGDLRAYLSARLTPPRTASMPTLLVAAESATAGLLEVAPDHPDVVAFLATRAPWKPGVLGTYGDRCVADDDRSTHVRAEFDAAGRVRQAWLAVHVTHAEVVADLAATGRRLLTPDEWEYAHGLGPGTLFPSGDRFERRAGPETVTGLRWGDPYYPELTAVHGEVRGSDLGNASCGGATRFYQAMVRIPAFRDAEIVAEDTARTAVRRRRYRPAMEVPPIRW
ncbi:hypothetical protein [Dactylosporangium sp. NPDC051541]|uniref:hypothetical protein n=1 Tax=Dactylosporangium sp. NPDC051541 TaxID=3363977 RepID=UPI0037A5D46A